MGESGLRNMTAPEAGAQRKRRVEGAPSIFQNILLICVLCQETGLAVSAPVRNEAEAGGWTPGLGPTSRGGRRPAEGVEAWPPGGSPTLRVKR